jgi:HK97 family phage major capsid protein
MTLAEQIAAFKAKRAETFEKLNAIITKSIETGETLDAEQKLARQALQDEIETIDEHLKTLEGHQALMLKTATVVIEDKTVTKAGSAVTVGSHSTLSVKSNLPPGIGFARMASAMMIAKGNLGQASEIARRWTDTPELASVMSAMANIGNTNLKAAVAAGDSNTSGWASQLVYYENLQAEFYNLLYPKTIIGRIPGLRRIPFNVRIGGVTSGTNSNWVGENNPIPVSSMAFTSVLLGHAKAASLVVFTNELARMSNPQAQLVVRDDMLSSMTKFADQQFIDPTVAAVLNVSPASITNGAVTIASAGNSTANIYADVAAIKKLFVNANLDMTNMVWVMSPSTALDLSMRRTTQDNPIFPDIGIDGGTWFGLPVITSNAVPQLGAVVGPPAYAAGGMIALVKADEIFFADDGGMTIDYTTEASIQMLDNPVTGATQLVSLFQNDLCGLRALREMNWQRRRPQAVAVLRGVNYA